ncbi:MAG: NUDIX domain-containing protein [archaeon]
MGEMNVEVDENDNIIGLRPREDFYSDKYIHRASHLILFNSKDEILLQKRSPTKKWHPNLYTFSTAGTVANETYEECIKKEIQEEIGLKIPVKFLFKFYHCSHNDNAFHSVFIGKSDEKITPDKKEMTSVRWISLDNLKKEIEKHPERYTPPFITGIKIFFEKYSADLNI